MESICDYNNGFIDKDSNGEYVGDINIEGINLSPICGQYFKKDGDTYIWIKRRPILEYDFKTESYSRREREPTFECYLKKQPDGDAVSFKGEFFFMRFRFSITGVWDSYVYGDSHRRLDLYIERMPAEQQTIINSINERKKNGTKGK